MLKEVKQAYEKAESLEKSRFETYKKYWKLVSFPAGKEVLNFLMKSEKQHLKLLKKHEKLFDLGGKLNLNKIKKEGVKFKPKKSVANTMLKGIEGDIGILKAAAELEDKDFHFYKKESAKTKDPESKKLFNYLKDLEKQHLNLIKKTIKKAIDESIIISKMQDKSLF